MSLYLQCFYGYFVSDHYQSAEYSSLKLIYKNNNIEIVLEAIRISCEVELNLLSRRCLVYCFSFFNMLQASLQKLA